MLAKPRKLFSLHILFLIMLIGGLVGVMPAKASPQFLLTATPTPLRSYKPLYISLTDSQTIGGIASSDEDILRFDGKKWSLFFDGSDVGVGGSDVFAFSILDADTILMAFNTNVTVNGISATPQDVLRFDASSLGSTTTGRFRLFFDGSDVGLADAINEKIDSLTRLTNGRLLISTNGDPIIPGVSGGRDEDVLAFTPTSLGSVTQGTWSLYFDGSDVGLAETSAEDIDAFDVRSGKIFLSTQGDFSVNGLLGADEDVFICVPTSLGPNTICNYSPGLYFDGSTWGLSANDVDAFNFLALGSTPPTPTATQTPPPTPTPTTFCPMPTAEPFQVEPVISPTDQTSQVITVYIGNGDWAKVSSESGVYTADVSGGAARVNVPLLTNTTHHLTVSAHVRAVIGPGGCIYGNYTLSTTVDRFGAPLTIVQQTGTITPSPTPGGNTLTLSPVADTYVTPANPDTNYGSAILLRADASPDIHSYLRFQVQGLTSPIRKATLRIFSGSTSSLGYQIRSVTDTTWNEYTLTYNNAPAVGDLIGSSGAIVANTWTTVDVTSYITGNGVFSLALNSTSRSAYSFPSRESSNNRPELILETQSGDVFIGTFTPSPANLPTATFTPNPVVTNPAGSTRTE